MRPSPDGEAVVVGDNESSAILVVERDGEPRPVAQLDRTYPMELSWSPDGVYIAVAAVEFLQQGQGYTFALQIVTLETGEINTVVENDERWATLWLNWSPDSKHLLFTMTDIFASQSDAGSSYADLWVYDVASGKQEQLTMGEGFEGLGVWSP